MIGGGFFPGAMRMTSHQETTDLFFYTGTGNSLWTARRLGEKLGRTDLHPIPGVDGSSVTVRGDMIGLIFPVHIWGVPGRVARFVSHYLTDRTKYYFAVAVNAGQVAATLIQLRDLMKSSGLTLSAGYDLVMPSNYLPWGGPGPEDQWRAKIVDADLKIQKIAQDVVRKKELPVEKGPFWQNTLFSLLYRLSTPHIPELAKHFWAGEKCVSCGICGRVCPAANIEMSNGRPVWRNWCEQCLACIQWCPVEAIQYGKKSSRYQRYHHPDITLEDMLAISTGKSTPVSAVSPD